jgi:UDP-N-acetylmuramate--alanine ligase
LSEVLAAYSFDSMTHNRPYFFCGIGGSGMLPLALILHGKGVGVSGSDRALDQGRTADKFDFLRAQGIMLFKQDGSGITRAEQIVVTSAAVEETVPDVIAARKAGAPLVTRAQLLAELFNASGQGIGVAGTSGKSTTTGMIGWILHRTGRAPTIMNGAVMKNFITPDFPFASAVIGKDDSFVAEVDESDGSIALYTPKIAVLNNVSLDHKSLDELRRLFADFAGKAGVAVLNLDNAETAALAMARAPASTLTYSLKNKTADFFGSNLKPAQDGIVFDVKERESGETHGVALKMPGRHNAANALAAIAAARAAGVPFAEAAEALSSFGGIRRRLEYVGAANGVTVIDDFGHNPDKIEASLSTLHDFPGRLLILFQPHGFGPLKMMRAEFIDAFARNLHGDDVLVMPDPVYFGGTTDKSVTSKDIVEGVARQGRNAIHIPDRAACGDTLVELAKPGDRIAIMGARDDTLSQFARDLVAKLEKT